MKSIVVVPPKTGFDLRDVAIKGKGIKIKIIENGICGTDREILNGQLDSASPPAGYDYLILGHEAIGKVLEDAGHFKKGDLAMPVNRRGCGKCLNCMLGRPDFCETGNFIEAGIKGMHGFMCEYIYDSPEFLVSVPEDIRDIAIMAQPLSDLEKSLEEIIAVQQRMYWKCADGTYGCRNALVIGTGTIGILFSLLLKSRGFNVAISNRREPSAKEHTIFMEAGITFFNSSGGYYALKEENKFDLIVEASGSDASLIPEILPLLRNNAILGLFGFTRSGTASISHEDLQAIVYKSIAIVGLINGQKPHFEQAMRDLILWKHIWPETARSLITGTIGIDDIKPNSELLMAKKPGEIKTKILWD
jgi:aldose 1-dehydrogenase [NAD(P)+]